MAETTTNRPAAAPADELDEILNYDADDDVFRDVDTNMNVPARETSAANVSAQKDNGAGLGIDEEIKVVKTRKPIPKLDEDRFVHTLLRNTDNLRKLMLEQTIVTSRYTKAQENCERATEI